VTRRRRSGFSFVELLVALAIGGGMAAAMVTTLARQQRFYSSAAAILDVRAQLRDAGDILATDIRGSALALGVPVMTDSAIEIFTTVASSIVCTSGTSAFGLPPAVLASGANLTSMLAVPDTGDLALVYIARTPPDSATWETHRITGFTSRSLATACPPSTGFTRAGETSSSAFEVTLASSPSETVRTGAPIRFLRRARYSLYRSSDNKWYLGYRRCTPTGPSSCAAIQPVAGPYDSYAPAQSGLAFRYFDRVGLELPPGSSPDALARIDIVIRGASSRQANIAGDYRSRYRDSVVISVAPRNRVR
jgi:prepilin-type N-terminal cleavage/methylation domain-containing protein